jgi:hypothetical protein
LPAADGALEVKKSMADAMNEIALGSIILVLAAVITLVVLPIANEAIQTYAEGPNGTLGDSDDPASSQVSLLELFPLTVIAALVIGGVAFLVQGFRHVRAS